jgi:hypothetical protein
MLNLIARRTRPAILILRSSFGAKVHITNDEHTRQRVASSVDFLKEHLDGGGVVYGKKCGYHTATIQC